MTVDEAVAAERKYFDEHPDETEYIREFVLGEFGCSGVAEDPAGLSLCHPCGCDTTRSTAEPLRKLLETGRNLVRRKRAAEPLN